MVYCPSATVHPHYAVAMSSTLYGRFAFPSIEVLINRLQLISATLFGHASFNTYLTTHTGEMIYGLSYDELLSTFHQLNADIKTLAATSSTPDGKIVRISVRFDPHFSHGRGHYLLDLGGNAQNRAVRDMILGEWVPQLAPPVYTETTDASPRLYRPVADTASDMQDWSTDYDAFSHTRPQFHLADTFYFNKHIRIEQLLDFLELLSVRYLNDTPFHAQLETTDGDYYFNIDSKELQYMFRHRRHVLFTLFLDAATADGQWIDLLLSFHPLHRGPNGEVALKSDQPDGIISLIRETLTVPAATTQVPGVQWQFSLDAATFSAERLIRLAHEISMDYLLKIPPVVFLSTRAGNNYTGLSLYQLERIYPQHEGQIAVLSVGITRALTGQTMSLMLQLEENGRMTGSLSMTWGDPSIQAQVQALIQKQLVFS